jgi:hypothetical protein
MTKDYDELDRSIQELYTGETSSPDLIDLTNEIEDAQTSGTVSSSEYDDLMLRLQNLM